MNDPQSEGHMASHIGRRQFVAALGAAAAAWPLAAHAQQSSRMRRVGVLMGLTESDPEAQSRIAAFRKTLQGLGWTEGRNVQADYYWAAGAPWPRWPRRYPPAPPPGACLTRCLDSFCDSGRGSIRQGGPPRA